MDLTIYIDNNFIDSFRNFNLKNSDEFVRIRLQVNRFTTEKWIIEIDAPGKESLKDYISYLESSSIPFSY